MLRALPICPGSSARAPQPPRANAQTQNSVGISDGTCQTNRRTKVRHATTAQTCINFILIFAPHQIPKSYPPSGFPH